MVHIHKLIDWTISVYIVHEHKVLLRMHEKYHAWFPPGGHIELDEDPIEAAKRECLEEVGLKITVPEEEKCFVATDERLRDLPNPAHMNIHYVGDSNHQHIDLIYYASSQSGNVIPENPDDTWMWLTKAEVEKHPELRQKVKRYALGALNALSS